MMTGTALPTFHDNEQTFTFTHFRLQHLVLRAGLRVLHVQGSLSRMQDAIPPLPDS